jgi:hypothetical protein
MDDQEATRESQVLVSEPQGIFPPSHIVLFGAGAMPNWEFIEPLTLTIERDHDQSFIASDDIFNMYGIGSSIADSVNDYFKVLAEYYRHLSADKDEPSKALFEYLQSYIRPLA